VALGKLSELNAMETNSYKIDGSDQAALKSWPAPADSTGYELSEAVGEVEPSRGSVRGHRAPRRELD